MSVDAKRQTSGSNRFRIEEVGLNSPLLEGVIGLHAAGKSRLGPFPQGAFEDHARQKKILAVVTPDNTVAGYLLYRVAKSATKNRASIVHLTTSSNFRGKGVARMLVDRLKEETRHLFGISLKCRRDYNIEPMWQAFGFTVRDSKAGRGADGAMLDYWWFDHGHGDLFSQAAEEDESVLTVVDANVFYDLICDGRPRAEDTRVLQADWLQGTIELCVTREIYNEIHRSPTEEEKRRGRKEAQRFRELKTDNALIQKLELELPPLFNGATFERDISDMRHVAHAIAAEAPFLVTHDTPMLSRSDAVFEKYGLRILHPTDLINRFDMLRREAEYRPVRLEGSSWRERLVIADDVDEIVSQFKHKTKERSGGFEQHVRHYLVKPAEWVSTVVVDGSKAPTVYFVRSSNKSPRVEIPMLRHIDHPLAGTLVRHLVHEMGREATSGRHRVISVADREISDETIGALTELGFVFDSDAWWKMCVKGIVSRAELVSDIRGADIPLSLKERLVGANFLTGTEDDSTAVRLEHLFSPVKLASSAVPCYVVSIWQTWAAHFFDIPEGGQTLMDLNEKLHLGIEGAYYCSAQNKHVVSPARILWYVSGQGSMSIKACSHLEEQVIGSPKEVFARFRHLGVFDWKHVLETADGKLDHPLMAFRFSRTERFVRPVTLAELQKMDIPQPQNPRRITGEQFATIYRLGMQL